MAYKTRRKIINDLKLWASRPPAGRHTATPGTYLAEVCAEVAALEVGECIRFSRWQLAREIRSFTHNDTVFTPEHRVMGNIIGSAYTHSMRINYGEDTVTFCRHEETGERYYSSPDDAVRKARTNLGPTNTRR